MFVTVPSSWFELFTCMAFLLGLVTATGWCAGRMNRGEWAGFALVHLAMAVVLVVMSLRLPWALPSDTKQRLRWLRARARRAKGEPATFRAYLYVTLGMYALGFAAGAGLMKFLR